MHHRRPVLFRLASDCLTASHEDLLPLTRKVAHELVSLAAVAP